MEHERVIARLVELKEAGNFTYEDIANISGIPVQTVRNIFTGKTPDPRFATLAKIVFAMGGDLNEIIGHEKKNEIKLNSVVSIKETYEMRISDLIKSYDARIDDVKNMCELRIADVQKCCETRLADIRKFYEERLAEQREMLTK